MQYNYFNQFTFMDGAYAEIYNDLITVVPNPKAGNKTFNINAH